MVMVIAEKIISYEQELDINDSKFHDEVPKKLLMSAKCNYEIEVRYDSQCAQKVAFHFYHVDVYTVIIKS